MTPRSWEVDFGRRKPARTYLLENQAHFRHLYELSGRHGSLIRVAMKDSRDSQRFLCRADRIEGFCGNLSIEALLSTSTGLAMRPIALLDDRKADLVDMIKETGICRSQKGPLNPKQLHAELKKPRYSTTDTAMLKSGTSPNIGVPSAEPDAERRLIYITDLNRYTTLVLLDTVSRQQAYFLRDFICNHLVFAPSIGVTIPFTSFKSFAFAFHLPYYACRKRKMCFTDNRCMADGRPLRRTQHLGFLDVTPLGGRASQSEDYIYEAQISCLVAGLDDSSYIGYAFIDTYHDGPQNDESVVEYHERSNTPGHYAMDPLSGGMLQADRPLWSPRIYFLRLLELRIEQVKEEWINVVFMIQKKTRAYTQDYQVSKDVYLSPDVESRGKRLRRFHDWTGSTVRLLMDLIHVLSKTLYACDRFQSRECEYFQEESASKDHVHKDMPPPSLCLAAIAKHVEEMRDQLQTLEHLEKVCNNISRELEAYLALEDRNSTMIQVRTNEIVKAITILTVLVSPPTVTSALYSMQDKVLPWEVDTRSWALTLVFFYLLLSFVLLGLLKRSDVKTDQALQEQTCVSQTSTWTKARRKPWKRWPWLRRRVRYPEFNLRNSIPLGSGDGIGAIDDADGTELSDLGTPAQPASLL
ncbi:hypothetical protein HD806DRAFT_528433 [Xylariaceae sp. AK1471]|nr:hypothetical protein HD806DRAFT_528433 [Xylariaceae sp. AK1471]